MLHQVIREHLDPFLREAAEAGEGRGLPQFVEREFREFLTCGLVEHGSARFRCEGCALEHVVPFSCKDPWALGPTQVNENGRRIPRYPGLPVQVPRYGQ